MKSKSWSEHLWTCWFLNCWL